ncbi:MAG: hypothetical protein ACMUIS_12105 [bacterium]
MEIRQITIRILKKIFADGSVSPKNVRNYSTHVEARYEAHTNPFRQLTKDTTRKPDQPATNEDLKMATITHHDPGADCLETKLSPYSN